MFGGLVGEVAECLGRVALLVGHEAKVVVVFAIRPVNEPLYTRQRTI